MGDQKSRFSAHQFKIAIFSFLMTSMAFAQELYPYAQYIPGVHIQQEKKPIKLAPASPSERVGSPKPKNPQTFTQKIGQALKILPTDGDGPISFGPSDFKQQREKVWEVELYLMESGESFSLTVPYLSENYPGHEHQYVFKKKNEDTQKIETFYQHSITDVAQAIANLPYQTRSLLTESVDLHFKRNPQDKIYQKLFQRPDFRAYQSAQIYPHGVLGIFPQTQLPPVEMMSDTMAHEAGHIWSFKCFSVDGNSEGWKAWREAMRMDGNQVTQYGASSFLEDAAEMALIYSSVTAQDRPELIEKFKRKFPNRWRILEQTYPGC